MGNGESWHDSWIPPREDKYHYYYFASGDNLWAENLIRQIQAQSYVNMGIVRPEGVITEQDARGNQISVLSPVISHPVGTVFETLVESRTEYALGVEKGSSDFSIETGRMVAWKKFYAPLEALPAYQFCKEELSDDANNYLADISARQRLVLVEPESLCKTASAERGAVKEFIRAEIQRALGKGEVWFMGLVEKTVYESWVHSWGPSAINKIGEPKKMTHRYNYDDVALVPTVVDIDQFFENMARDIASSPSSETLLRNFVYMTDGISTVRLGAELAALRRRIRNVI